MQESCKSEFRDLFPRLQSNRLILRQVLPGDSHDLYHILNDSNVNRFISFNKDTLCFPKRIQRYFEDCYFTLTSLHFAVVLKQEDSFIGLCSFQRWNERDGSAVLGYLIGPEYWNQGYATEAAGALLDFGFEQLRLQGVYASCDVGNLSSRQVLIKCGFEPAERSLRGQPLSDSQQRPQHHYVRTVQNNKENTERSTLLHK